MPLARTPLRTAGAAGRAEWAWGKSWLAGAAWPQATSGAPAANARQATAASGGRRRRLVMDIPGHGRLTSAGDGRGRYARGAGTPSAGFVAGELKIGKVGRAQRVPNRRSPASPSPGTM